jgi:hypothetical protein
LTKTTHQVNLFGERAEPLEELRKSFALEPMSLKHASADAAHQRAEAQVAEYEALVGRLVPNLAGGV